MVSSPARVGLVAIALVLGVSTTSAQDHHAHGSPAPDTGPIHTTMDALHQHGGVPPGWTFKLPAGDPAAGRAVFVTLGCFACHDVKGEQFPGGSTRPGGIGPELTGMGSHHPAEYLAESIVNPNRVIVDGPGYTGPDRLSRMPDYTDSLTVRQLVDLVAYLKSLGSTPSTPESGHGATHDHMHMKTQ